MPFSRARPRPAPSTRCARADVRCRMADVRKNTGRRPEGRRPAFLNPHSPLTAARTGLNVTAYPCPDTKPPARTLGPARLVPASRSRHICTISDSGRERPDDGHVIRSPSRTLGPGSRERRSEIQPGIGSLAHRRRLGSALRSLSSVS